MILFKIKKSNKIDNVCTHKLQTQKRERQIKMSGCKIEMKKMAVDVDSGDFHINTRYNDKSMEWECSITYKQVKVIGYGSTDESASGIASSALINIIIRRDKSDRGRKKFYYAIYNSHMPIKKRKRTEEILTHKS